MLDPKDALPKPEKLRIECGCLFHLISTADGPDHAVRMGSCAKHDGRLSVLAWSDLASFFWSECLHHEAVLKEIATGKPDAAFFREIARQALLMEKG